MTLHDRASGASGPEAPELSDLDLHLYLAKAMPWRQRLYLRLLLVLNGDLRGRLSRVQAEVETYRAGPQASLHRTIFGHSPVTPRHTRAAETAPSPVSFFDLFSRRRGPLVGFAGALAALALFSALWPVYLVQRQGQPDEDLPLYTAKGGLPEMQLYVKGDTLRRVQGAELKAGPRDTLQFLPAAAAQPYVAIYGYEVEPGSKRYLRIFPAEGESAARVSVKNPPPGLTVSGVHENRLICLVSDKAFDLKSAENALRAEAKPQGWRVQAFTVRPSP